MKNEKTVKGTLDGFLLLCYNNNHNSGNMPFFKERNYESFCFVMAQSSFH